MSARSADRRPLQCLGQQLLHHLVELEARRPGAGGNSLKVARNLPMITVAGIMTHSFLPHHSP